MLCYKGLQPIFRGKSYPNISQPLFGRVSKCCFCAASIPPKKCLTMTTVTSLWDTFHKGFVWNFLKLEYPKAHRWTLQQYSTALRSRHSEVRQQKRFAILSHLVTAALRVLSKGLWRFQNSTSILHRSWGWSREARRLFSEDFRSSHSIWLQQVLGYG